MKLAKAQRAAAREGEDAAAADCLVLVHVPKTAGRTLSELLRERYGDEHTLALEPEPAGELPDARPADLRLVLGHRVHGVHRLLGRPCRYVTMLRHPVARIASMHAYALRTKGHYLHERLARERPSLLRFVREEWTDELFDDQTRLLAGIDKPALRADPAAALERARRNLAEERFAFAGVTERFDESLLLMARALGWRSAPVYARHNVAPRRQEIDPEAEREILARNRMDLALWEELDARVARAVEEGGLAFRARLRAFRAYNALHARGRALLGGI